MGPGGIFHVSYSTAIHKAELTDRTVTHKCETANDILLGPDWKGLLPQPPRPAPSNTKQKSFCFLITVSDTEKHGLNLPQRLSHPTLKPWNLTGLSAIWVTTSVLFFFLSFTYQVFKIDGHTWTYNMVVLCCHHTTHYLQRVYAPLCYRFDKGNCWNLNFGRKSLTVWLI